MQRKLNLHEIHKKQEAPRYCEYRGTSAFLAELLKKNASNCEICGRGAIETARKKAYNSSINRVRPCALSAASTGSCAADEGRPAVHGLHPAAAWTWVQARPAAALPGSETCWIHALLCAVCHTGGRFIFNVLSGKIPFY